ERALSDAGFDQAAFLCLQIAAGNRREVNLEATSELAWRRQTIGRGEATALDIGRNGVRDREIARLVESRKVRGPFAHCRANSKTDRQSWPNGIPQIDCIVLHGRATRRSRCRSLLHARIGR